MTTPDRPRGEMRQEPDRVERRGLRIGALLAIVGIASSIGASVLLLRSSDRGRSLEETSALDASLPPTSTAESSLVTSTERGIDLRAEQRAALERWAWVDRDAGIAEIPIERAMDLVAADGGGP